MLISCLLCTEAMAPPHQVDLSPLARLVFALQDGAAGEGLLSSPYPDGRSTSPPCPYQAKTAGMSLSSGKEDTQ